MVRELGYNSRSAAMDTVLVIDDDSAVRDTVGVMLEREGFRPVLAADGDSGLREALSVRPELILVDLKMPGLGGAEVCKRLRDSGVRTPVIVLSALAGEMDKVELLDLGADDYMVKPFGSRELLARIRALLRRSVPADGRVLEFADVRIDLTRRIVEKSREEVKLTRAEYNLLTYFLQNADRVLTREMILNSVWGYDWMPNTRTVDAHVVRLRQKLETRPARPLHFLTVHGVGYRFLP
jgi:DNA-binding response OmpR family regulator